MGSTESAGSLVSASPTWYVTFEIRKRSVLLKGERSRRETRMFASEAAAKSFAHARLQEELVVFAGTINPNSPKRLILFPAIPDWLNGQALEGDESR